MIPAERDISNRVQELVLSQLEGNASFDEQQELAQLLRDHPWAHEFYIDFIQDTSSLRWWSSNSPMGVSGVELTSLPPRTGSARGWVRSSLPKIAGLAASVLVVLGFLAVSHFQRQPRVAAHGTPTGAIAEKNLPSTATAEEQPASVATVTRLRGVQWADKSPAIIEMSRLTVGQVLQFDEGEIEIIFDHAVQLVIRGPAQVQIRSPHEIFSTSGVLAARVGKSGIGFTIETPAGRITDLGTEFGVAVGDEGSTEVAVFRGAVDLSYGPRASTVEPSVSRRLVQGQALRLDANGRMRRLVSIEATRFPTVETVISPPESKRSSIITDVRDNVRDGVNAKCYRIVPSGLHEDVQAYVDREHQWNGVDASGIPPLLIGADYVMPFNGDKLLSKLSVKVSIGQPALLYVFLSDVARVPDWLTKEFKRTDMRIGLDESAEHSNPRYRLQIGPGNGINTQFSVWSKEIHKPTTITLGSIEQGIQNRWGFCMYGIAAVPLETVREIPAGSRSLTPAKE